MYGIAVLFFIISSVSVAWFLKSKQKPNIFLKPTYWRLWCVYFLRNIDRTLPWMNWGVFNGVNNAINFLSVDNHLSLQFPENGIDLPKRKKCESNLALLDTTLISFATRRANVFSSWVTLCRSMLDFIFSSIGNKLYWMLSASHQSLGK